MIPLEEIYPAAFFSGRNRRAWRAPIICGAVNKVLAPRSVLDVGCGIGDLIAQWLKQGVKAFGLEGSLGAHEFLVCPEDHVLWTDLRKKLTAALSFDLVTCFEVAEHIEPVFAPVFVRNLTLASDRVLMSAAPPGQEGHHHVNCRPLEYWIDRLSDCGYEFHGDQVAAIQAELEPYKHKKDIKPFYYNMLYFQK